MFSRAPLQPLAAGLHTVDRMLWTDRAERSFELAEAGWRAGRFAWFRAALAARDLVELRTGRGDALSAPWTQRIVLARAKGGDVP